MKKLLLLILLPFIFSCTNYYSAIVNSDTPLYETKAEGQSFTVVPANTTVYIKGKKATKYRKIKYGAYTGYAVNPSYGTAYTSTTRGGSTTSTSSSAPSSSSSTSSAGKTVHVKGYTRKDGTYVKPHTRSAPKRKG